MEKIVVHCFLAFVAPFTESSVPNFGESFSRFKVFFLVFVGIDNLNVSILLLNFLADQIRPSHSNFFTEMDQGERSPVRAIEVRRWDRH